MIRPAAGNEPGLLLPQHVDRDGAWCPGSGQRPAAAAGRCRECGATADSIRDPDEILAAALARQVRVLLYGGPVVPVRPVPLDPEPESISVLPAGPLRTLVRVSYPGGTTRELLVAVIDLTGRIPDGDPVPDGAEWRLEGWDTFEGEAYPLGAVRLENGETIDGLRPSYPSYEMARAGARRRLADLERTQPSSGGQESGGLQDRVYIIHPDGHRERVTA